MELLAADNTGGRVTVLAQKLGTSKTRIFRHLRTLTSLGYVIQDVGDDSYRVGVRLARLGQAMADQFDLLKASRPIMRRLRDSLGNTVVLSVLEGAHLLTAEQMDGHAMLAIGVVIGSELGLHSSAQGKIALAFGPAELLEQTLRGRLKKQTSHTITDPEKLRKEVTLVRKQGWAIGPGETMTGLNALAAPIFIGKTGMLATLAVLGSIDDITARPTRRQISEVVAAAQEITKALDLG